MTDVSKTTKRVRLSWRRQPNESGLRAVCQLERGCDLWRGQESIAHVRPTKGGWYWYGLGQNTDHSPARSMDAAKDEVFIFMKRNGYVTR